MAVPVDPEVVFRVVDVTGVVANGLLGGALARSKHFDPAGFVVLALCAALGGGILRDLLLNQGFPVALTDPFYLIGALTAAFVSYFIDLRSRSVRRALILSDFLALGCWSATGASKALLAGLGPVAAVLLGVVTAVGGGIIRDVVANDIPGVFGGQPIYATVSVLAATQMVFMQLNGHPTWGMALAIVLSAVLATVARKRRWILPTAADGLPRIRGRRGRPLR